MEPQCNPFVRSWAEVLGDAEHRHLYLKEALAATSDEDAGLEYLNRVHHDLLPEVIEAGVKFGSRGRRSTHPVVGEDTDRPGIAERVEL
jgi:hypothetical protein